MSKNRAISIAIGVGLTLGALGILWRVFSGHEPAAYSSYIPWGLWIAMYFYFSGIAAGSFLLATMSYVWKVKALEPIARLSLFVSFAALASAMVLVSMDLGHMDRAYEVFLSPNPSSVMMWMVWMYAAFGLLCVLMLATAYRQELVAKRSKSGFLATIAGWLTFGRHELTEESCRR